MDPRAGRSVRTRRRRVKATEPFAPGVGEFAELNSTPDSMPNLLAEVARVSADSSRFVQPVPFDTSPTYRQDLPAIADALAVTGEWLRRKASVPDHEAKVLLQWADQRYGF